jgi:hypothetical protein
VRRIFLILLFIVLGSLQGHSASLRLRYFGNFQKNLVDIWWPRWSGTYGFKVEDEEKRFHPIERLSFTHPDLLPDASPSFTVSTELHPWGENSFLKNELTIFRGSIGSIRDEQMQLSAIYLVLYRRPVTETLALFGDNFFQAYTYSTPHAMHSPTADRRLAENRTSVGVEYIYEDRLRLRLPVFFEQSHTRRPNAVGIEANPWRYAAWVAPQVAFATSPESELLLTTSTQSFVSAELTRFVPQAVFKPTWFELRFRTDI